MELAAVVFYALAVVTIVSALGVVVTRSIVYSALLLIVTLGLTGLVYLVLLADFLALVQILVYGGTVSILLLFALMLTPPQRNLVLNHQGWPLAAGSAVVLFVMMVAAVVATDWRQVSQVVAGTTGRPPLTVVEPVRVGAEQIGTTLLTIWAVPFEIAAVVLLVALIGSLLIAQAGTETGRV
jgi:NADH-quinone oxidoreductase subunit J